MYLDGVKIEEKIYENGRVKEHIFYDKQGNKEEKEEKGKSSEKKLRKQQHTIQ